MKGHQNKITIRPPNRSNVVGGRTSDGGQYEYSKANKDAVKFSTSYSTEFYKKFNHQLS